MPIISFIPERFESGFKELSLLNEEVFNNIQKELSSVDLVTSTEELSAKIASLVKIEIPILHSIFLSIGELVIFLEEDEDYEEIGDDVVTVCLQDKVITSDGTNTLKNRVIILLKSEAIFYLNKARDLTTETSNLFLSSRVLTDIRPIFDLNAESQPKAGIITHNLHIHYQSSTAGLHHDIYFTLNSDDISLLIDMLIRAEKKEEQLEILISKTGMKKMS